MTTNYVHWSMAVIELYTRTHTHVAIRSAVGPTYVPTSER